MLTQGPAHLTFGKGGFHLNLGIAHEPPSRDQEKEYTVEGSQAKLTSSKLSEAGIGSQKSTSEQQRHVREELKKRPQVQAADQEFGQVDCAILGEKVLTTEKSKSEASDISPNMVAATEPMMIITRFKQNSSNHTKPQTGHIFCKKEVMNSIQRMVKMD